MKQLMFNKVILMKLLMFNKAILIEQLMFNKAILMKQLMFNKVKNVILKNILPDGILIDNDPACCRRQFLAAGRTASRNHILGLYLARGGSL